MHALEFVDEAPDAQRIRLEWRAVEEDDRGADGEDPDEPVPHHPAGRRVLKDHVGALQVAVEDVLLFVLQEWALST